MLKILLGLDRMPAWFALSGLVAMHAVAFASIKQVLLPWMVETSVLRAVFGTVLVWAGFAGPSGNSMDDDRLALLAVAVSCVMHLATFYPYFLVICLSDGIDNQNPRDGGRVVSASLKGRLLAAHQNQLESFPGFAASVLTAVYLKSGSAVVNLAWIHVFCRSVYWVCYVINVPNLRSMAFVTAFYCVLFIFYEALKGQVV
jgi:uncharacterized MAPEG superfamily protein